jgi:hypothetical protein
VDATSETRQGIDVGLRLALSHHPLCARFESDVAKLGSLQVCSGCLASWPAVPLGVAAGVWVVVEGAPGWAVAASALALGLPQVMTYLHRGDRMFRALAKILGGFGLGAFVVGLVTSGASATVVLAVIAAFSVAFLGLQALRMKKILDTCDACPWRRQWAQCPGFNPQKFADPIQATFDGPLRRPDESAGGEGVITL